MEEYIRLEEEKAQRHGKTFNWQTTTYDKVKYYEDEDNCFKNFQTKCSYIVFDDTLMSDATLSCEPTVSPFKENKIDFKISFDESNDEDYMVIFDNNSFSYKIIYVDNLKTDLENDNDKVNMPLFPSPEPTVSYFDDLDHFKNFENEFPAIVYDDALTSKLDFLTEPTLIPQHINEFNLKDETSFSECDKEEQNILYFNDLFPLNVIYYDDLKSAKDNDNDEIQSSRALSLHTSEEMAEDRFEAYWLGSERVIPDKGDLRDYWIEISSNKNFLGPTPSYVYIRDTVRRLCHRMISYSISGRAQAPKKYFFRHAKGRKSGARLSGGYFIGRLAAHFGLVSEEGLRGLSVITRELSMIDLHELVRLNICVRLGDLHELVYVLKYATYHSTGSSDTDQVI
ncbi:hypothetical protein Tco_1355035 [Tanacetum coccineum]